MLSAGSAAGVCGRTCHWPVQARFPERRRRWSRRRSFLGRVGAVVSRGGRQDLAGDALEKVEAPTLLIVGGADFGVIELNEQALARLREPKALEIAGASHLFPEPGALEAVTDFAAKLV